MKRHKKRWRRQGSVPRKENAHRRATTRAERQDAGRIDHGTPELRARRRAAVNDQDATTWTIGKDRTVSLDHPLSIMLARHLITPAQHRAGMRFAQLAWASYGKPFAGSTALYLRMLGGSQRSRQPEDRATAVSEYHGIVSIVSGVCGASGLRALRNAAQYCHMPRWLVMEITGGYQRESDRLDRHKLRDALEVLVAADEQHNERAA